jgi:hypothetical protein
MADEINLRYKLSEDELLGAIRAQSMRSWSFRFLVVLILIMLVYVGVQQIMYGATLDLFIFSLAPIVIVALILVVFTYYNPIVRYRIRKQPKYIAEQTWKFSEDNVHWKTEYSESTSEWKTYSKIVEDKQFFWLFLQSNLFTPIPKRAFSSPNELSRFRELLKRKIKPAQ